MSTDKHTDTQESQKVPKVEVYWTTVTYKTVAIYITLGFAILLLILYLLMPDRFMSVVRQMGEKVSGSNSTAETASTTQARFVNLDGKVQIKKVNSVEWVNADYRVTLDKGDLVRTGSDGVARMTFPDGTTYTVKADTLITVEENSMAQNRTNVSVNIRSGAVDLSTGAFEPGSKSEVSFENARASLQQNTRAAVRSDPENKQHEITVTQGQAELSRAGQQITIAQYERVSFPTGGEARKSQVVAPPRLKSPANLQPLSHEGAQQALQFEWEPVQGAVSYTLRISPTSSFNQNVREVRTANTSQEVTGLAAGDYFWSVTATDAQKRTSDTSDTFKFSLFEAKAQTMLLEIESTQVYGNQVEIVGRTEPGAVILIAGQTVTNLQPDGRFRYFTPPLPKGLQIIKVIVQNRRGGFNSKDVKVPIQ